MLREGGAAEGAPAPGRCGAGTGAMRGGPGAAGPRRSRPGPAPLRAGHVEPEPPPPAPRRAKCGAPAARNKSRACAQGLRTARVGAGGRQGEARPHPPARLWRGSRPAAPPSRRVWAQFSPSRVPAPCLSPPLPARSPPSGALPHRPPGTRRGCCPSRGAPRPWGQRPNMAAPPSWCPARVEPAAAWSSAPTAAGRRGRVTLITCLASWPEP